MTAANALRIDRYYTSRNRMIARYSIYDIIIRRYILIIQYREVSFVVETLLRIIVCKSLTKQVRIMMLKASLYLLTWFYSYVYTWKGYTKKNCTYIYIVFYDSYNPK